jgi:hypothetical protein
MLEKRLEELRREFQTGRELLERLDRERTQAHETLLRISGAIQVLEELTTSERNEVAA